MSFILFIGFIILQRIAELVIARSNEKWARERGAVEYGREHYGLIVAMHTAFLLSIITEYLIRRPMPMDTTLLIVYLLLFLIKVWTIASLGRYWNTKILRVPGAKLVDKGPYKFIKHPNYVIVICEIILIPLVFHLYYTALIFSLLNAMMLTVRIWVENRALRVQ